ncbi:MAG: hypothetical protein IPI95_02310 [Flavobacteriales bacterium]|nr:hypothetical protein [Flavobacteriales bacterium]
MIGTAPSATISYAGSPYCTSGGTATVTRTGSTGGTYSDAIRSFDQFEHGRYHVGHEHCGQLHGDVQHRSWRWLFGS